jgi:exopolysaccharide biosynthesis polyprenyl glycosylphosphotransferase
LSWGHPERGKVLLLAGDFALAGVAMSFATLLHPGYPVSLAQRAGATLLFLLVFPVCFYVFDLYDVQALNGTRTVSRLLAAAVSGTCLLTFFLYFFPWLGSSRGAMVISLPLLLAGSYGWRHFYKRNQRLFHERRAILLIGTMEDALDLHAIAKAKNSGAELLGLLHTAAAGSATGARESAGSAAPVPTAALSSRADRKAATALAVQMETDPAGVAAPAPDCAEEREVREFGVANAAYLEELVRKLHVDTLAVHPDSATAELAPALTRLRFRGVRIATTPDLYSELSEELPLETLSDSWLSFATGFQLLQARLYRRIKRVMDILLAVTGLLASLPIALPAAAAIKLESPGPVFFRQWRVGWMERPFRLVKFRSMRQDAESDGKARWASVDDPRITRVGRILRLLHIDEIPQMINVLAGQMSFVGPRPERPAFVAQLKRSIPFYHLRHYVPPGITGWAQVNYPYGSSVADARRKLQYDLYYVRNASPTLDLRILLLTIRVVLFRRGSR